MSQRESLKENKKYTELKKVKIYQNLWDTVKALPTGKFIVLYSNIRKASNQ